MDAFEPQRRDELDEDLRHVKRSASPRWLFFPFGWFQQRSLERKVDDWERAKAEAWERNPPRLRKPTRRK